MHIHICICLYAYEKQIISMSATRIRNVWRSLPNIHDAMLHQRLYQWGAEIAERAV